MTDIPPPSPKSAMILILLIAVVGALITALAYTVTSLLDRRPQSSSASPFTAAHAGSRWSACRRPPRLCDETARGVVGQGF
jgi:hypothetical protein